MTLESADYFFFENMDFDQNFYDTPVPSQDIWKKFELLLTPPRSPTRDTGGGLSPSAEDTLQMVSEYINEDGPQFDTVSTGMICDILDGDVTTDIMKDLGSFDVPEAESILISDCMWSASLKDELYSKNDKGTQNENSSSSNKTSGSASSAVTLDIEPAACVNPAAVFPCPAVVESNPESDSRRMSNMHTPAGRSTSIRNTLHMTREHSYSLGIDTPSPSDSEEEIDVVTVEKDKYTVCTKRNSASSSPNTTVVTLQPGSKHLLISKSSGLQSVNLSMKRTHHSMSTPNSPQSHSCKKLRREASAPELKNTFSKHRVYHPRNPASSSDIDSEDSDGKRTQHNVLERKRRDDLRYSFLTLRDHVPELQERAPKVTILKTAAEYIQTLISEEQTLSAELDRQKDRKEQLLRRLSSLRRNSCI